MWQFGLSEVNGHGKHFTAMQIQLVRKPSRHANEETITFQYPTSTMTGRSYLLSRQKPAEEKTVWCVLSPPVSLFYRLPPSLSEVCPKAVFLLRL